MKPHRSNEQWGRLIGLPLVMIGLAGLLLCEKLRADDEDTIEMFGVQHRRVKQSAVEDYDRLQEEGRLGPAVTHRLNPSCGAGDPQASPFLELDADRSGALFQDGPIPSAPFKTKEHTS